MQERQPHEHGRAEPGGQPQVGVAGTEDVAEQMNVAAQHPAIVKRLLALAQQDVHDRWLRYEQLARKDESNGA